MEKIAFSRMQIDEDIISISLKEIGIKTLARLREKGHGTFSSRHEILGVITEEYNELVNAVQNNNMENFKDEILDIAVACHFALACINSETLEW